MHSARTRAASSTVTSMPRPTAQATSESTTTGQDPASDDRAKTARHGQSHCDEWEWELDPGHMPTRAAATAASTHPSRPRHARAVPTLMSNHLTADSESDPTTSSSATVTDSDLEQSQSDTTATCDPESDITNMTSPDTTPAPIKFHPATATTRTIGAAADSIRAAGSRPWPPRRDPPLRHATNKPRVAKPASFDVSLTTSDATTRHRVLVLLPPSTSMDCLNLSNIAKSASLAFGQQLQFSDIILSVAHGPMSLTNPNADPSRVDMGVQTVPEPAAAVPFFGTKPPRGVVGAGIQAHRDSPWSHPSPLGIHDVPRRVSSISSPTPIVLHQGSFNAQSDRLISTTRPTGHGPAPHHVILRNLRPSVTDAQLLHLLSPTQPSSSVATAEAGLPASLVTVYFPPHNAEKYPGRAAICFFANKVDALAMVDRVAHKLADAPENLYALRAVDLRGYDSDQVEGALHVAVSYAEHQPKVKHAATGWTRDRAPRTGPVGNGNSGGGRASRLPREIFGRQGGPRGTPGTPLDVADLAKRYSDMWAAKAKPESTGLARAGSGKQSVTGDSGRARAAADSATEDKAAAGTLDWRENAWVWRPRTDKKTPGTSAGTAAGVKPVHEPKPLSAATPTPKATEPSDVGAKERAQPRTLNAVQEGNSDDRMDDDTDASLSEDMLWQYFEEVHLNQLHQHHLTTAQDQSLASDRGGEPFLSLGTEEDATSSSSSGSVACDIGHALSLGPTQLSKRADASWVWDMAEVTKPRRRGASLARSC